MALTLKTDKLGLAIVDQARGKKNWSALAVAWCQAANVSVSTLKRFRERKSIQKESFVAICQAVGIEDWEMIVDDSAYESSVLRRKSRQAKQRIAEEILSNLNHLDARLDFVEQTFSENPIEVQLQTVRQQVTPALIQDVSAGYHQLMQQQSAADLRPDFNRHPLRIEANVSIIQIMVNL